MKKVYKDIWLLAKPFYEKGRVYDAPHIEWMMKEVERISAIEEVDEDLLMPLCILHDVGYSTISEDNPHIKDSNSKKMHMEAGKHIARKILEELGYPPELITRIVEDIGVHDNWCLGDDSPYKKSKEMALFNDLDFLYSVSSLSVLEHQSKSMGKKLEDMMDFWENDEKHSRRPFCCKATKDMYARYIQQRKKELGETHGNN